MKIIFTVFALLFSTYVSAMPLNNIVVFGDSLSDNGNLYKYMGGEFPSSPPYYQGRFTNGQVWVELLAAEYYPKDAAAHLQNYAFGGAGVSDDEDVLFSLHHEIDTYFLAHQDKADNNSLFLIWVGANNYLNLPESEEGLVDKVVKSITADLKRLADKGAKHILVVNLPDLGRTPAARDMDAVDRLTQYSIEHNRALRAQFVALKEEYKQVKWYFYNVYLPFSDVLKTPEEYGFTNVTDTCYNSVINENTPQSVLKMVSNVQKDSINSCEGYFFFDLIHPSALAHQMLKDKVKILLDKRGVKFH